MKRTGFTLVELLVVVLIIGVLTAVAVPMYQSAVDKSHFSTMLPGARAIKNAEEAYWMANGYYTNDETSLDVSAPAEDVTFSYEVKGEDGGTHNVIRATNSKLSNVRLASYLDDNTQYAGQLHCEAVTGDERANKLCGKTLLGAQIKEINTGYMSYLLNDEMDEPTCGDAGMSWSTSKEKCYKDHATRCNDLGGMNVIEGTSQCGYKNQNGKSNEYLVVGAEGECLATEAGKCGYITVKDGGKCVANPMTVGNSGYGWACNNVTIENGGVCEVPKEAAGNRNCFNVTVEQGGLCVSESSINDACTVGTIKGMVICNGKGNCGRANTYDGGICAATLNANNFGCGGGSSTFKNGAICYSKRGGDNCNNANYDGPEDGTGACCCGSNCGSKPKCQPDSRCTAVEDQLRELGYID